MKNKKEKIIYYAIRLLLCVIFVFIIDVLGVNSFIIKVALCFVLLMLFDVVKEQLWQK